VAIGVAEGVGLGLGVGTVRVMVKLQVVVLPATSVAVHVSVVVSTGKVEPDGGTQAAVTPGQLSLGLGVAKVSTVGPDTTSSISAGQVMKGG
jgi:hypothetical protein